MQALQLIIPTLVTLSLAAMIVVVGLDAELGELVEVFRRPLYLLRAVAAVDVIVPLAAVLLVLTFPLSPVAKAGILLMAVSPVPPTVPSKQLKLGARAYGIFVWLAALSIVTVPLAVTVLGRVYDVDLSMSVAAVAGKVALSVLLPLAVGLTIKHFAPNFARRARSVVAVAANILIVVAVLPMLIRIWPAMLALNGDGTVLAMATTTLIALAAGHLLGGPGIADRAALAVTAASRHPGIAMMIATANTSDKHVTAAIVLFVLTGVVIALPYQAWMKRRVASANRTSNP